ncbi:MAG: radical SAM protein, partial [Paracoccaceae bacterium]|nr:radical SAM protein [Paracoccaceae bacterium]
CVIPFGRGNSRSVPEEEILRQIQKLVDNDFKEIVLTGVDLTSWGNDLLTTPKLGSLVNKILSKVPNLPRLRLSSIDSVEVDEELIEIIINEPRFMPHLHLSLQSGDNLILKRMKRRHSREQAIDFCQAIQRERPELTFGADIITGFPTETALMFKNSIELINECNLTWLHIFPFSARAGTPASRMPPVNGAEIKKRSHELRALGQIKVTKYLNTLLGKKHAVLIEGNGKGRTEAFAEVMVDPNIQAGIIKKLIAHNHNGSQLICS